VLAAAAIGMFGLSLLGCVDEPPPRSYVEFMDDRVAREGTLVRCNADRAATASDPECINARRAATTLAARADEAQRAQRDAASERRRMAARDYFAAQQAAQRQAESDARAQEELAYEAQWDDTANASDSPAAAGDGRVATTAPELEFIALPRSAVPPLRSVDLPSSARRIDYSPARPQLEEIVLPELRRPSP
jgi:hypothetical protein